MQSLHLLPHTRCFSNSLRPQVQRPHGVAMGIFLKILAEGLDFVLNCGRKSRKKRSCSQVVSGWLNKHKENMQDTLPKKPLSLPNPCWFRTCSRCESRRFVAHGMKSMRPTWEPTGSSWNQSHLMTEVDMASETFSMSLPHISVSNLEGLVAVVAVDGCNEPPFYPNGLRGLRDKGGRHMFQTCPHPFF